MDVAVRVRDDDIELLPIGQEIGSDNVDGPWRFAEESELVGFLLDQFISLLARSVTDFSSVGFSLSGKTARRKSIRRT